MVQPKQKFIYCHLLCDRDRLGWVRRQDPRSLAVATLDNHRPSSPSPPPLVRIPRGRIHPSTPFYTCHLHDLGEPAAVQTCRPGPWPETRRFPRQCKNNEGSEEPLVCREGAPRDAQGNCGRPSGHRRRVR